MDDQLKLGYEFASALSRDLITLATGTLALSVTFAKDIVKSPKKIQLTLLAASWGLYLISILAGIFSLMKLTGSLVPVKGLVPVSGIPADARAPAKFQVIVFAIASLIFIVVGVTSLIGFKGEPAPNKRAAPDANRAPHDRRR